MKRTFTVSEDAWLPIETAPITSTTDVYWGLDPYEPGSTRFAHAYMMRRGGPGGSEWYCGNTRVHPAFWQFVVLGDAA